MISDLHRWLRPLQISSEVIGAVILRDMRTRFGGSHYSYLLAILWPFLHLFIIVAIYNALDRAPPLGTDGMTYFALAIIPFILYLYPMRQISLSVIQNKPLLYFPRVKVLDLIAARIILESIAACAVCIIVIATLVLFGREFDPYDYALLIGAFASALYIGIAIGMCWALVCAIAPGMAMVTNLWIVTIYLTGGILFVPDLLPDQIRWWVSWNPLLHSVEMARTAYYPDFHSQSLDANYLFWFPTTLLFIAFVALGIFKKLVLSR